MFEREYFLVQDGERIDTTINKLFSNCFDPRDFTTTKNGVYYNFVGFITNNENTLVSFPKHTFNLGVLKGLSKNKLELDKYIRMLFKCVITSGENEEIKYDGIRKELNSNYPFIEFQYVYNYYKNYGLFSKETEIKRFSFGGRISWKDTINKSPKVINNNNLVFLPLVVKDKIEQHVFISKCMAYVINSTMERFNLFLSNERIDLDTKDIDFSNKLLVISQLKKAKSVLFKDVQTRLINSLISFFENDRNKGGDYQIKIYSFNLVWENMIKELLSTKFSHIDKNFEIIWSEKKHRTQFVKRKFHPDNRLEKPYTVEPDYYLINDDVRYIFDAKYYQVLKELDYKQIAYYFLLKHFDAIRDEEGNLIKGLKTHNALFLPTEGEGHKEIHFELKPSYNEDENKFLIMAYYINTLYVMRNFTS